MSMITEQVERIRRLADEMEKSTFVHEATHFIAIKALREAADTIEQLAAKMRAENNISQPCEDAIPIPDNATNGDVIKAVFPNASRTAENDNYVYIENLDSYIPHEFFSNWWNSPYKRGETE